MKLLLFPFVLSFMIANMSNLSLAQDKVIIAHRGASGYLPEHTLEAKAMAHAFGSHFIEQDVVLTKDGVPVVLHDHYLDTVTDVAEKFPSRAREDGRFYAIDFSLAEIKTLNAHERIDLKTGNAVFPKRFPIGLSSFEVPTLEEELELIKGLNRATGQNIGIYPEIKAPAFHRAEGQDISRIVLDVLKMHGYATKDDAVYVQCFDWNETQRIRKELGYKGKLVQLIAENDWGESPDVNFNFLKTAEGLAEIASVADGIGPWIPQVIELTEKGVTSTGLVARAHENGLEVHPYTARMDALPPSIKRFDDLMEAVLFTAGADGIFSDFPDKSLSFLVRRK